MKSDNDCFDRILEQMTEVRISVARIEERLDEIQTKVDKLEASIEKIKEEVSGLKIRNASIATGASLSVAGIAQLISYLLGHH